MLLTVSTGGPPTGHYSAKFVGLDETKHEEYGGGLRWKFEVVQGEQAGKIASRTTGLNPSSKNGCGKMLSGLMGRELKIGEKIDVQELIGREFLIVVAPTENGGTRVEAVVPHTPAAPTAPANSDSASTLAPASSVSAPGAAA